MDSPRRGNFEAFMASVAQAAYIRQTCRNRLCISLVDLALLGQRRCLRSSH
jgi:hypothetical protein